MFGQNSLSMYLNNKLLFPTPLSPNNKILTYSTAVFLSTFLLLLIDSYNIILIIFISKKQYQFLKWLIKILYYFKFLLKIFDRNYQIPKISKLLMKTDVYLIIYSSLFFIYFLLIFDDFLSIIIIKLMYFNLSVYGKSPPYLFICHFFKIQNLQTKLNFNF